jgi:hypothetical protein
MTDIQTMELQQWTAAVQTKYAPIDSTFLQAATDAGFYAFTHLGGLFGAQSGQRAVHVIHRGMGKRWEVIFVENGADVVTTTTTNLNEMTSTMLNWLRGRVLMAKEDSVYSVAG